MPKEIVITSEQDVSRFVDSQPAGRGAWLIVVVALGGVFVDAYDFTSLGIGVVQLKAAFGLTPFQVGSVTAMMAFGAFCGALCGGYYTDKIGRFKMFLLDLIFLVIAAIGAALAVNLTMLLFFRFLMGIGVGLDFPVALSFIAEFMNRRRRGGSINLWQPMWYVAASATGLVALPFYLLGVGPELWRVAVGFGAVPALLILALRYRWMDESPLWAARNLSLDEAARVIRKTYGVAVQVVSPPRLPAPAQGSVLQIFSPLYRTRTLLASIICMTQSAEYFAIGFNLPAISAKLFGGDFIYAIMGAILFNLFGIVGGGLGAAATAALGIRRLAIFGYALVIASLVSLVAFGPQLSVAGSSLLLGLFIFGHSMGPGAQGMTMAALSFPTRIRGIGTGWGQAMVRVGSIAGFYFFPLLVAAVGMRGMLLWLVIVPVIGLVAAVAIPWEPVGQDLEAEGEAPALDLSPAQI